VSAKAPPASDSQPATDKVSFYSAWCKRCGNCVAFCPRKALSKDEWGYPVLDHPDRCTACGLCEMLCPDFALSVGEAPAQAVALGAPKGSQVAPTTSPERLAPAPGGPEDNHD
jgi:2-oxoglutarate ferredoxin oxidoreductase subunit delta